MRKLILHKIDHIVLLSCEYIISTDSTKYEKERKKEKEDYIF